MADPGGRAPGRGVGPVSQSCRMLCSGGCNLDLGVKAGRIVRGRDTDRVNRGRHGPKGLHGWVANHATSRLTRPTVRRGGELREANWGGAMELVVRNARGFPGRQTANGTCN